MTLRPNAWAGGGCYLFPPKFVYVKVGYLYPVNSYGKSVRLTAMTPHTVVVASQQHMRLSLESIS